MDKLSIKNEMRQFDSKHRDFYDELTEEEHRKFSNYLMIRWGSTVTGSRDLQEFYVISTNERLNKHFFTVNQHPKLQWLMATSVSPNLGSCQHRWIAPKKRDSADGDIRRAIANLYPAMKSGDVELLARLTTKKELQAHLRDLGQP